MVARRSHKAPYAPRKGSKAKPKAKPKAGRKGRPTSRSKAGSTPRPKELPRTPPRKPAVPIPAHAEDAPQEEGVEEEGLTAAILDDEEGQFDDALFDGQQALLKHPGDEGEEREEGVATEVEEPDTLERDPHARPPVVAIVGRPNVGKSTLLNALSGSRIAIVEPTPGVTRDRVGVLCTLADRTVELVDTGGVGVVDAVGLSEHVEQQVAMAIAAADVILFVLDAREGRVSLDERVAGMLRRVSSRVIPVANKAEKRSVGWNVGEFEGLGFGAPQVISAQEKMGLEELEEVIAARLPTGPTTPRRLAAPAMKLAIVGRVNAGKSSLVNALVRQNRMIVSSVPGTTRDTVDVRFEKGGLSFVVIDTAGIRKERSVQGGVNFYAQRRAERAMRRADVTALVLDATDDVGRLDRQIAGYALEHHHPVLVVANKWDLRPPDLKTSVFAKYLRETLSGLTWAPIVFTTATTGRNVDTVIDVAQGLFRQAGTRIATAALNKAIEAATSVRSPRPRHGKIGRIFYGTQVEVCPPTFVMFVNDPELFDSTYRRYLENQFRTTLPIPEVPLRVFFKQRTRSASKNLLGPIRD